MKNNNLEDIEEIKRLKAKYFRLMDKKRWDQWGDVFADDAILTVNQEESEFCWQGRKEIVANISANLEDAITVHQGHTPEIEITSDTTAHGIWAMYDFVEYSSGILKGYGHYEEDYVKKNGQWQIKTLKLTRIRVDWTPKE